MEKVLPVNNEVMVHFKILKALLTQLHWHYCSLKKRVINIVVTKDHTKQNSPVTHVN
jgi:hypothetical protein